MHHLTRKKIWLWVATFFGCQINAHAADLLEVYQQALTSDPTYQQAISQQLATDEGVPISLASLLPTISVTGVPSITRTAVSGTDFLQTPGTATFFNPRNNTLRAYSLTLTLSQTVFNFAQFANLKGALATAKGAQATLNYNLQSLMTRTAKAYFAVLQDEENLSYSDASKRAYAEQLDQIKQQYQVGLKTITDVYTAQASYDTAVANYIAAQTTLADDRENLRVITGKYYPHLSTLSDDFPLISPNPHDIEEWVKTAQMQNWQIKTAQYNLESARQNIHQQFAGHLPQVTFEGKMDRLYTNNINGYPTAVEGRKGPGTQTDRQIALNIDVPIFSGGGVTAATNQATYQYETTQQQLEQTVRNTINTTRQSYLGVLSGISLIKADKQSIKSNISSLHGMEESYKVGTETLVDVLNQQQKVYSAQTQYATDRYAFVNNILALKQAAGTLSFDDLRAINAWLVEKRNDAIKNAYHAAKYLQRSPKHQAVKKIASRSKAKTISKTAQKKVVTKKIVASKKKNKSVTVAHRKHASKLTA